MATLSTAQLQTILTQVLGRDGLNINRTYQNLHQEIFLGVRLHKVTRPRRKVTQNA